VTAWPRVLRGAFVEYGPVRPGPVVPFQFNPVALQRSRTASFRPPRVPVPTRVPGEAGTGAQERQAEPPEDLRSFHRPFRELEDVRTQQEVVVTEEHLAFDLRLDATDALEVGGALATTTGIAPSLAALERMALPPDRGVLAAVSSLLGGEDGLTFTTEQKPPIVLFLWGAQRVLPVNITSLSITETEFDAWLNPVRATASVQLSAIEGENPFATSTAAARDVLAELDAAARVVDIRIPG
jgi:hypothetical protein